MIMKKNIVTLSSVLLLGILINGCSNAEPKPTKNVKSSIISGYLTENGHPTSSGADGNLECVTGDCPDGITSINGKTSYEKERDHLLTKIVKTPPVPMRVPDTVLRVLVLPYVDDSGALTAQNYKFVKVDDGKWILGEYLAKEGGGIRMLTPLNSDLITEEKIQSSEPNTQQNAPVQQNPMYQPNMTPQMER